MELIDGALTLRIPLSAGGDRFVALTAKIGRVVGQDLCVGIPQWLSDKLGVKEGSLVVVSIKDGKFTITRSPANDRDSPQ